MESQRPESLAAVVRRCASYLRRRNRQVAKICNAQFLNSLEGTPELELVPKLTKILEKCTSEHIARLYDVALQHSKASVAIAADIIKRRGETEEECVEPLMINNYKIIDQYFEEEDDSDDDSEWLDISIDPEVKYLIAVLQVSRSDSGEMLAKIFQHLPSCSSASPDRPIASQEANRLSSPAEHHEATEKTASTSTEPAKASSTSIGPAPNGKSGLREKSDAATSEGNSNFTVARDLQKIELSCGNRLTRRLVEFKPSTNNAGPAERQRIDFQEMVDYIVRDREHACIVEVIMRCFTSDSYRHSAVSSGARVVRDFTPKILSDLYAVILRKLYCPVNIDFKKGFVIEIRYVEMICSLKGKLLPL